MKFQITNSNFQTNPNDQNHNVLNGISFGHWEIEVWSLFGIWCLELGGL